MDWGGILRCGIRWRAWLGMFGAVSAISVWGCKDASLTVDNRQQYFASYQGALYRLDQALDSSGLRVLSARSRSAVEINNHAMPSLARSATRQWVDSVLQLEGVPRATFDHLEDLLDEARIRYVVRSPDVTVYVVGGTLDNLNGFLHVRPGAEPPPLGTEIDRARLVIVNQVDDDWYYFGTS